MIEGFSAFTEIWDMKLGFIAFALGLFYYIFTRLLVMSRNENCNFHLRDLVMADGAASKSGVILMSAFLLTSLYFMYAVLMDKMTETLFLAYAGVWVTPQLTKMVTG